MSRAEFSDTLRSAYATAERIYPRRRVKERTNYKGMNVDSVKISEDWQHDGLGRKVYEEKTSRGPRRFEMVLVSQAYFCREGDQKWTRSSVDCAPWAKPDASPVPVTEYYGVMDVVRKGKPLKILASRITYREGGVASGSLLYSEEMFWMNESSALERREAFIGIVEPKTMTAIITEVFDYDVKKIEIVAPIK